MGTQPDQQAYSGIERSKRIAVRQPGASAFGSAANLRAGPRFEFLIGAYRYAWHLPRQASNCLGYTSRRHFLGVTAAFAALPPIAEATESSATLRSEEHTSELQSLMRTSYAVSCLT